MSRGGVYIGTSGWSYPHWAKGRFYPKGLRSVDWLGFLARHFPTVEVNSTFYRLPPPGRLERWHRMVGCEFRFALKLGRNITHLKRLVDCRSELQQFLKIAAEIGSKRGPLLVQLPPSLGCDLDRLAAFFDDVESIRRRHRWKLSVEFRNPDWLRPEVNRLLDRHSAALCLADMPRCTIEEPNDVPFVYVRRHGPGGRYRGRYGDEHIRRDARRIASWVAEGRSVFVYYNNDLGGHAVDNARQLMARLGACAVVPTQSPLRSSGARREKPGARGRRVAPPAAPRCIQPPGSGCA